MLWLLVGGHVPAYAQGKGREVQQKVIPASKLPSNVTKYISDNLPNARITRAVKQKRSPDATYVVNLTIKTKAHTLVFNKAGALVKLDGKALKGTVPKRK